MELAPGLYEQVIDDELKRLMERLDGALKATERPLDPGESHVVLAQHLAKRIARALAAVPSEGRVARQVAMCNDILDRLSVGQPEDTSRIAPGGDQLMALAFPSLVAAETVSRPDTPLAASCLFTGTRLDPSLVSQLRKELRSADQVDILCSFIKWSGLRVLEDDLNDFTAREGTRLRVITTSYMGATDLKAVDFLQGLPNTEIRVSYDTKRTRLHAKAYLFHRNSTFGTAYVGSANLSHAALSDGLEWNVKVSAYEAPHLWAKLSGTFETYWNDPNDFEPYESTRDAERLALALRLERTSGTETAWFDFDLHPYPFQQEILDRLRAERQLHGRYKNLVVAATGTGKTVIAAFDYLNACRQEIMPGKRPRLLFVAHREEILQQSAECFRRVLKDRNFGDVMVGGHVPGQADHLFLSIQSFNSKRLWESLAPDAYDYLVVDEFHHAAASGYRQLLEHFTPRILLGLTATPERMDGKSVLGYFDDHIAAEIRLPEAINRKLLCPFQYFGATDSVDYSRLRWQSGGYLESELEAEYIGNDERTAVILRAMEKRLLNVQTARAVGFCVKVSHAEYMAAEFQRRGLRAAALSGRTPDDERRAVQAGLRSGDINYLFVVDLLNEGVDIPEIDTILLLRPTESLTVFLQQIGRGLRLSDGKDCLTILDFIGQANQRYDFEARFRALADVASRSVDREMNDGFPHAPAGCVIELEEKAQQYVLENIRQALNRSRSGLVSRIASFEADTGKPATLANFIHHYDLDLDNIYARASWSRLSAAAGIRSSFDDPDEAALSKGLRRLARINSERGIRGLLDALTRPDAAPLDEDEERLLVMLQFTLWGPKPPAPTLKACLSRLRENSTVMAESLDLLHLRYDQLGAVPPPLRLPYDTPLELHAHYSRDEALAALGHWTLERQPGMREGVLYLPDLKTDVLLVTLNKTEKDYSPTTMYEDYALGPDLFHWQSQSTTAETSKTGQRYIHHGEMGGTVLLFVRENGKQNGDTAPYDFLGPVE
jgi:superfamily II DNA or RNA helicase/HKD family nuclease